jgi:apolipoprotein N-acyltransferase
MADGLESMGIGRAAPSAAARRWGLAQTLFASLIALCAGYLHACAIAAPWDGQPVWWLQIVALAVLAGLVQRAPGIKTAALLGWLFATSWLCGSVWWLYTSMHTFGGLAAPLAVLAVLALCGFMALFYAAACGFYKHFSPLAQQNVAQAAIIFAACWLLAELVRDTWLTGFPWAAGGYAQVDGPLAGLAAYVGVYGVGWVSAVLAALLAWAPQLGTSGKRWLQFSALLSVCVIFMALPWFVDVPMQVVTKTPVALLQGNIPQGEKFDNSKGIPLALDWYAQQLAHSTASLVIGPETAIPVLPQQLPDAYWQGLSQRFSTGSQAALIGLPLGGYADGYTNSAMGWKPGQKEPYVYSKHHLVPFGEFIPPWFKWFTQMMNIPLGDFNRGAVGQPSFAFAGQRWAPNICYEDLFGDELAARFKDPATAPTVLVNLSNIGWFGNSIAIDQHLHISRMRSLELGRPMLRATNTGPTVIIDHRGRVTASLARHTRGVLVGEVEGRSGTTPYAWWAGRFGLWPLWLLAIAIILVAGRALPAGMNGMKKQ